MIKARNEAVAASSEMGLRSPKGPLWGWTGLAGRERGLGGDVLPQ